MILGSIEPLSRKPPLLQVVGMSQKLIHDPPQPLLAIHFLIYRKLLGDKLVDGPHTEKFHRGLIVCQDMLPCSVIFESVIGPQEE